jgi:hypothetical protein
MAAPEHRAAIEQKMAHRIARRVHMPGCKEQTPNRGGRADGATGKWAGLVFGITRVAGCCGT